jgi:hypothetical protein
VGLSATLPNYDDVAALLRVKPDKCGAARGLASEIEFDVFVSSAFFSCLFVYCSATAAPSDKHELTYSPLPPPLPHPQGPLLL